MSTISVSPASAARLALLLLLTVASFSLVTSGCGAPERDNGTQLTDDENEQDDEQKKDDENEQDDIVPVDPGPLPEGACRTEVAAAVDDEKWTPLCQLEEGTVQHVRIEGMGVSPGGHQAAQFLLGYDAAPTNAQDTTSNGQLIVQMYAGTPRDLHIYYGSAYLAPRGERNFTADPTTLCFDLVGGSDTRAPALTLWITGENGADCRDFATLTKDTAWVAQDTWLDKDGAPVVGDVDREAGAFAYQAKGVPYKPVVTLFPQSVASCETVWVENTDMQPLCEPAGGATRFRVEDVKVNANNSYFYVVTGVDASDETPATQTAEDDGKLVLNGGKSHLGESATFFPFDGVNRPDQHVFKTDQGDELYVVEPNTICAEFANVDDKATVHFWATGAKGADCADDETLTKATATYIQTFEKPFGAGKKNFVKASNSTNVSLGRVVVSNDRLAP